MKKWWQEAIFYHIYPLGFCGVQDNMPTPFNPQHNLSKIEKFIEHLVDLGVNAVYLGPVFSSSRHGYDTADYYHIDSRLGTDSEFKELCRMIKNRGIRIILDGVFHHTGRDFWAFRDIQKNHDSSDFIEWFSGINFYEKSPYGDNFSYNGWEGHYDLVKLNLGNTDVVNHILGAVKSWIMEYDIDGIRLDVAYALEKEFLYKLSAFCRNLKNDFFLLGEVIHGEYRHWLSDELLDSVTNYQCYKGIYSAHNEHNLFELAHSLERQCNGGSINNCFSLYNFVDNHDVNRIASSLKDPAWVHTAYIVLFTMPGIPSIYYGSEWAVKGERTRYSDHPLRPSFENILGQKTDISVENTLKRLIRIRQNSKALQIGGYKTIHLESDVFAFLRYTDSETVIVMINSLGAQKKIQIPFDKNICFVDVLNNNEQFYVGNNNLNLLLYPKWGRVLVEKKALL